MGVLQKLASWASAEGKLQGQLANAQERRRQHELAKPTSADPAEHRRWRAEGRDLDDEIASIEDSLRIAAEEHDAAEREAKRAKGCAGVEDVRKEAKEFAPRVRRLLKRLTDEIAPELQALKDHEERVREINKLAASLGLPPVIDGEQMVRETPPQTIPAVTRKIKGWFDKNNEPCPQLIERDGKMVPIGMSGDYEFREIEVVQSRERFVGAQMPERLADALLPSLAQLKI